MCYQTYQVSFLTLWVVFTLLMVSFGEQKVLNFNIIQFIHFFLWLALFCVLCLRNLWLLQHYKDFLFFFRDLLFDISHLNLV